MKFYEVQKYLVVSDHGAMEDVVLFNPTFWNSLPEEHRNVIVEAFSEVIDDLIAHKQAAVTDSLEEIKAAGIEVRELTSEEKAAFRDQLYPATRQAYLERTGEEGAELIELYEKEYEAAAD